MNGRGNDDAASRLPSRPQPAARQHRDRRPRQDGGDQARPRRARLRRPRPARGRARHGEDGARARDRGQRRGRGQRAHPVHARPAAERRHGPLGVQPEGARLRVPARAGVRQRRSWSTRSTGRCRRRSRRCSRRWPSAGDDRRRTRTLPEPFLVLATENPIEQEGTFPLPEAQLDRFFLRTALGYPSEDDELAIVEAQRHAHPLTTLRPATRSRRRPRAPRRGRGGLRRRRDSPLDDSVRARDREVDGVAIGASVRGSLALERAIRAWAILDGRDYVTPVDVERLFLPWCSTGSSSPRASSRPRARSAGMRPPPVCASSACAGAEAGSRARGRGGSVVKAGVLVVAGVVALGGAHAGIGRGVGVPHRRSHAALQDDGSGLSRSGAPPESEPRRTTRPTVTCRRRSASRTAAPTPARTFRSRPGATVRLPGATCTTGGRPVRLPASYPALAKVALGRADPLLQELRLRRVATDSGSRPGGLRASAASDPRRCERRSRSRLPRRRDLPGPEADRVHLDRRWVTADEGLRLRDALQGGLVRTSLASSLAPSCSPACGTTPKRAGSVTLQLNTYRNVSGKPACLSRCSGST